MSTRKPARGFVLVIVLAIAAAAAIIAAALLSSSEQARVGAANALEGDVSDALAKSGMERANAYLSAVAKQTGDLDLALDPNQHDSCRPSPTCTPDCNMPVWSDGHSTLYDGKQYMRVDVQGVGGVCATCVGGSYLVRFDDDSDDEQTWPGPGPDPWAANTGNTPQASPCAEGPGGDDDPFRDRNRAVTVTSIGIAPGTDPAKASHRTVIRRLFTHLTPPTVPAVSAVHDVNAGGGTTSVAMCSPFGDVEAQHNFNGGGGSRTCTCGDSRAAGGGGVGTGPGGWSNCDGGGPGCGAASNCATGLNATPAPASVPTVAGLTGFAFDWAGGCNFFVGGGANFPGINALWYWDKGAADRMGPGVPCPTQPAEDPPPDPNPAAAPGDDAVCWTPLVLGPAAGPCVDPFGQGQVDPAAIPVCMWRPKAGIPAASRQFTGAPPGGTGGTAVTLGAGTFTFPDWATCQISYPTSTISGVAVPHTSAGEQHCTACDGVNVAMYRSISGPYWFAGLFNSNFQAVPAGSYYYPGDLSLNGLTDGFDLFLPTPSGNLDLSKMPHATIVVGHDFTIGGGVLTHLWFGVGANLNGPNGAFYPSIIAGHDVVLADKVVRIAGSVWAGNDIKWNGSGGTHIFDGEMHAGHDVVFGGNGTFTQQYFADFRNVGSAILATVPLTSISQE